MTRRSFLAGIAASAFCSPAWSKTSSVKIGVCTRDSAGAAKCGFDYIEPAAAEIAAMSEEQFRQYSDQVLASPIRCHAFNSFIRRPELKVVGNEVSLAALGAGSWELEAVYNGQNEECSCGDGAAAMAARDARAGTTEVARTGRLVYDDLGASDRSAVHE